MTGLTTDALDALQRRLTLWGSGSLANHFIGTRSAADDCQDASRTITTLRAERDARQARIAALEAQVATARADAIREAAEAIAGKVREYRVQQRGEVCSSIRWEARLQADALQSGVRDILALLDAFKAHLSPETAPTMAEMQAMTDPITSDPDALDAYMNANPLPDDDTRP